MLVSKRTVNMAHCTSDTINIVNNFNPAEIPIISGASTAPNLLLQYIKDDDAIELKYLFEEGRVDVNHIFGDDIEYNYAGKNVLQISCAYFAHETSEKCIKVLLNFGADVFYEEPNSQKNALHFAAEGGNSKILRMILKHIKDNNYDISDSNVIYSLIKHINEANENDEAYVQILRILLTETNIDVNYEEIESGKTAIYLAAKYKFEKLINQFMENKFNEINLDGFKDGAGKSARQLIIDNNLYEKNLPEYVEEPNNISIFLLYKNIRRRIDTGFADIYFELENRSSLSENDKYSLLRMAVKYNMEKIVDFLLQQNINFDKESKREDNPLVIACQKGYYKLLQLLMDKNPSANLVTFALFELLKSPYYTTEISDVVNYQKCIKILKKKEDVNYNSIALQYSLKYHDREMTLKHLQRGATLACKFSTGQLAIADIDSATLEAHLNKCVTYEEDFKTSNDAYLVINFTSLLPDRENISSQCYEQIQPGAEKRHNMSSVHIGHVNEMEMRTLLPAIENQENIDPAISSRDENHEENIEIVNNNENINQEFTNVPIESSVNIEADGKKNAEEFLPETDVIYYIATSNELQRQLKHPIITLFLNLKWFQIQKLILFNLALYISFIVFLLLFIIFHYNEDSDHKHTYIFYFAHIFLAISLILLIAREIFQMNVFKYQYFLKSENWLELFLFFVTAAMLVVHSNEALMRQLSAMAIITAAIEFLLLIGRLQFISTHITILRTVSYTFLKLFLLYSVLLFAFAYSFYTLFKKSEQESVDDKDKDFFEHYGMSVMKTIIMLTGEFDASSIKFDAFPGVTHLIFVAFLFLITIVLFNLLNGLAVSDTQLIKNNAELYNQIMRAELISLVEKVLITKKSRKFCLSSNEPFPTEIKIYPFKNWKMIQVKCNQAEEIKCHLDKNMQQAFTARINQLKDEAIKSRKDAELRKDLQEIKQYLKSFSQKQRINIGNNKVDTLNIVTNY